MSLFVYYTLEIIFCAIVLLYFSYLHYKQMYCSSFE